MKQFVRIGIATLISGLALASPGHAAPTLIVNVDGYTLSGDRLAQFDALAFRDGKVLATGHAADLRSSYAGAQGIDGHGKTLLPGLIDAHGHVVELGLASVRIKLEGSVSLKDA